MEKKELLIKQNAGKKEIENYTQNLNVILNIALKSSDFIDLETTEKIIIDFFETYIKTKKVFTKNYKYDDQKTLNEDIEIQKTIFQDTDAYLITKKSEICGAVKIPFNKAIENYTSIIELDGDSLNLVSIDTKRHFYLDSYEEYGKFYFELSIW